MERYIPHPIKNGETVQFGDVFGIFRVLEEETDLPMTQFLEMPETTIAKKHRCKVNHTAIVSKSPEVSDRVRNKVSIKHISHYVFSIASIDPDKLCPIYF